MSMDRWIKRIVSETAHVLLWISVFHFCFDLPLWAAKCPKGKDHPKCNRGDSVPSDTSSACPSISRR